MKHSFILAIGLLVMLTACKPSPSQQATMTATAMTATAASWTSTPTATATSTPTVTPSPTPTNTPTKTPTFTPTPEIGRYYAPDKSYSLVLPDGWEEQDRGSEYPFLVGPRAGGYQISLFFFQQEYPLMMAAYSAGIQDSMKADMQSLNQISEDFLTNAEKLDYFRWEYEATKDGQTVHNISYFFESGDWKLIVTYSRLPDQGAEYDAIIDAMIDTLRYKR